MLPGSEPRGPGTGGPGSAPDSGGPAISVGAIDPSDDPSDGIVGPIAPRGPAGIVGAVSSGSDGIVGPVGIAGIACPDGAGCGEPVRPVSLGNTVAPVAICALSSAFITG